MFRSPLFWTLQVVTLILDNWCEQFSLELLTTIFKGSQIRIEKCPNTALSKLFSSYLTFEVFILNWFNGYRDLVLHLHKVGEISRDRICAAEVEISWLFVPNLDQTVDPTFPIMRFNSLFHYTPPVWWMSMFLKRCVSRV